MDELVKLVSKKTGLPEDISRKAVEIVVGYLKAKLPPPLAGQIDGILGNADAMKGAEGMITGMGGLLGRK